MSQSEIREQQILKSNTNNNNNILERYKYSGSSRLPLKARKESITLQKREDRTSPDSSVSPESPFRCSLCPSSFREELGLTQHITETHKLLTPTRCPLCQDCVRDLPHHISLHHPHRMQETFPPANLVSSSSPAVDPIDLAKPVRGSPAEVSMSLHGQESPPPTFIHKNGFGLSRRSDSDSPPSPQTQNILLRTTSEMLRAASSVSSSNSSSPILNLTSPTQPARPGGINGTESALPMNLSVRHDPTAANNNNSKPPLLFNAGRTVANLIGGTDRIVFDRPPGAILPTTNSDGDSTSGSESTLARKRRKQTHVPDCNKDERYWARRMKNNEAAKRSRDMRIKREKVVFEENARLERLNAEARADLERLATDNKELHLKLDLILEENTRLKSLLLTYQAREEIQRKRLSGEYENIASENTSNLINRRRTNSTDQDHQEQKPFPFPESL